MTSIDIFYQGEGIREIAHFEADPENKTDDSLKGRAMIHEMEELLKQKARKS